jgi:hypothetical protein
MTTRIPDTTFQLRPTASTLRVGARLMILAGLCAALVVGFVSGLSTSSGDPSGQVAAGAARCGSRAC